MMERHDSLKRCKFSSIVTAAVGHGSTQPACTFNRAEHFDLPFGTQIAKAKSDRLQRPSMINANQLEQARDRALIVTFRVTLRRTMHVESVDGEEELRALCSDPAACCHKCERMMMMKGVREELFITPVPVEYDGTEWFQCEFVDGVAQLGWQLRERQVIHLLILESATASRGSTKHNQCDGVRILMNMDGVQLGVEPAGRVG